MTKDDKITYLRIALALQNFSTNNEVCDRIITTYEKVLEMGEEFSLKDAVEIECRMDEKYTKKKLEDGK